MMEIQDNLNLYDYDDLEIKTLVVHSEKLKDNPQNDRARRVNPVLLPKEADDLSVVLILAGFTGNGGKYFNQKSYEPNAVDVIAEAVQKGKAPKSVYIFVDAWSFWGGSQFINSIGCGNYEDYIVEELVPAIKTSLPVTKDPLRWAVTGGSSGGYGALHLGSKYPDLFANIGAIAPDSFFQMSLLPEIYSAWSQIIRWGGVKGVLAALRDDKILGRRDSHATLNAIGMGLCYAGKDDGEVEWPINDDGEIIEEVWNQWLKHDPINFLQERKESLLKINALYIDVGKSDQFHLQFGCRQIHKLLKTMGVNVDYSEFKGNHFDIGDRRINLWNWLNDVFSK